MNNFIKSKSKGNKCFQGHQKRSILTWDDLGEGMGHEDDRSGISLQRLQQTVLRTGWLKQVYCLTDVEAKSSRSIMILVCLYLKLWNLKEGLDFLQKKNRKD